MTIIHCILQIEKLEQGEDISITEKFFETIPFMESESVEGTTGADEFKKLQPPRFMKSHLPYQLWKKQLEKHPNLKIIQTIRNPKDTLVSYYHHYRASSGFKGTWDQFFEIFKEKKLAFGDFFEINSQWYKFNRDRPNSLVLRYEEMKKDPKVHVRKIAKFMGHELSDKAIDIIVGKSSVKAVSKKFDDLFKNTGGWKTEKSSFVRKGEVGDWVNYFSEEQSQYVEVQNKEYLEPLGIVFEYSI